MKIEKIFQATSIQSAIIAGYLASASKDYIGQVTIKIKNTDHLQLNNAVQKIYSRHEALRTAFDWQHARGVQGVVADQLPSSDYVNQYEIYSLDEILNIKKIESELINLNKPPLIRLALISLDDQSFLLWSRHHAVTDQESIKIFWKELWHYYSEASDELPQPAAFSTFAESIRNLQEPRPKYHQIFSLPPDNSLELSQTFDLSLSNEIHRLQQSSNVTLAVYSFSAFCLAISDFFGSNSISVGYVESDRPHEFKDSIGLFIKESSIQLDQFESLTLADFRRQILHALLFHKKRHYNTEFSTSKYSNSTQIGFLFEDDESSHAIETLEKDAGIGVRLKLFCRISIREQSISINLTSQSSLVRSSELDWISIKIKEYLLKSNDLHIHPFSLSYRQTLLDILWSQWRFRSDNILNDGKNSISGMQLYLSVQDKVKQLLSGISPGPHDLLILKPSRSIECIINILSSIEAGLPFLLTEEFDHFENVRCVSNGINIAYIDEFLPLNLAYIIKTSGSTGTAKSVMIHLKNIINHLNGRLAYDQYSQNVALTSSWTFDASLTVLFSTMAKGGTLSVLPLVSELEDVEQFIQLLNLHKINEVNLIPSLLRLICDYGLNKTSINTITSAGEELQLDLAYSILKHSHIKLINEYGPSECTILATRVVLNHKFLEGRTSVPIGYPIQGCQVRLMRTIDDENEICISGDVVGLGYLSESSNNQTKFLFSDGSLWYKTGDSGSMNEDGSLNWLGRLDHQHKINGKIFSSRVFERDLLENGAVECVCILDMKPPSVFYTVDDQHAINAEELQMRWRSELGISIQFNQLKKIPRNISGKVNILELKTSNSFISPTHSSLVQQSQDHRHVLIEEILGRKIDLSSKPILDVDSLTILRLTSVLNQTYNTNLTVNSLIESSSWLEFMKSLVSIEPTKSLQNASHVHPLNKKKREYR